MENTTRYITRLQSERLKQLPALAASVTPPQTPTSISSAAHQLLCEVQAIHDTLSGLDSLAPCEQVNTLLTRLVNLSITPHSSAFESQFFSIPGVEQLCEQIRPICATAEGELEKAWARKMLEQATSSNCSKNRDLLQLFPYHTNYIDLSRLEYSTLLAFLSTSPTTIAFIGSGPLPLTSLCMLDHLPSSRIVNIDRDAEALSVSRDLCSKLGYTDRMEFVLDDVSIEGSEQIRWGDFEVVFLAALVGTDTSSKMEILAELVKKLRVGTLVVARSAKGMRSILYPILGLSPQLERIGLEVLVEVHPWTKVVNSVIVFRVL